MKNHMAATVHGIPSHAHEERQSETSVGLPTNKTRLSTICQSLSMFACLIMILTIPILQLFIGWRYSSACPIHSLIPHYLIVAGIVGLLLVLLIGIALLITGTYARRMLNDAHDRNDPNRATMLVGCGVCSILCVNLSLFIFLVGWTIAGWMWIIEVWHGVQYHSVESSNYCHPTLYRLTFSILLITTILKMIFAFSVCRKTCGRARHTERKLTVTSENFENLHCMSEHHV